MMGFFCATVYTTEILRAVLPEAMMDSQGFDSVCKEAAAAWGEG